ncbi:HYR-like domain-containing protein [Robertkochia sediminum]|uniref:HYR-like domain-containing protein n=1 Tax=Robertkochia sediminum TaxID=2785326 RepID=UPI001931C5BA|nr:hypothetical protein [Robertkochia sediminum]MBL7472757.1 hypothetical protein [Robertkochia sediminum]
MGEDVTLSIYGNGTFETDNKCNASQRIFIGTDIYSACNGQAGTDKTFDEIVDDDRGINSCSNDVTAPVPDNATLPDITDQCSISTLIPPTATDNCSETVTVTNDVTLPIIAQGTTVVTWTFMDEAGNTATQTQNVVIDDVTAPTPDVTTLTDVTAQCEVTSLTPPTATDNCGGAVTISNDATLPITAQGTTTVTWTFTDAQGNSTTATQDVVITDTTPPVVDAATLQDVTAQCEVTSLVNPTATDNCGGAVTISNDTTLPITAQGTTTVTWTFTDAQGNSTTATQDVVITDVTPPTPDAATLADVTAECLVTALTPPTATDNCGGVVTVTNNATLPITAQGTTVVTWTYTDENGVSSTQDQNIIIDDVTFPTATPTLPSQNVFCAADIPAPDPTLITDEADNCGIPDVAWDRDETDAADPNVVTRYYTVTDAAGNQILVTQEFTVSGFTITAQPADVEALIGDDVSFTVASANGDSFQWQVSTDGGTTWNSIDGVTNPSALTDTLLLTDVSLDQNEEQYRVLVGSSTGTCPDITSNTALLNVIGGTVITNRNKTFRVNRD